MSRGFLVLAAIAGLMVGTPGAAAPAPSLAGRWSVRADQGDASIAGTLELKVSGDVVDGHSGPLDTLAIYPLELHGALTASGAHVQVTAHGEMVGALDFVATPTGLSGSGKLFGTPVVLTGVHADVTPRAPMVIDYDPTQFHVLTSNLPAPVLHVQPGDVIRTRTVDNYGHDEHDAPAAMPGNPGTGPFYVDGAMPGDTLAIHILKLTPNRGTARMNRGLDGTAVAPGYAEKPTPGRTDIWLLDPAEGLARIQAPSARLKGFKVALRPMLGVVGVAPPASTAVSNSDLGEWGGNLDFPELGAGLTLYLPVYQPGGMLFMGDAHARQGEGEITGQGLETSMAVEFKVDVVKGPAMRQPWSENADFVMVSGIGGSLDEAFRRATTGLAGWLKARYQLDDNDVAEVLGSSIEYEIAEVVDPKYHVVARLRKSTLAMIRPAAKADGDP